MNPNTRSARAGNFGAFDRRATLTRCALLGALLLLPAASPATEPQSGARKEATDAAKEIPIVGHIVKAYDQLAGTVHDGIASFSAGGSSQAYQENADKSQAGAENEWGDALKESLKKDYPKTAAVIQGVQNFFGAKEDPVQFTLDQVDGKVKKATGVDELEDATGFGAPSVAGSPGVVSAVKATVNRYQSKADAFMDEAKKSFNAGGNSELPAARPNQVADSEPLAASPEAPRQTPSTTNNDFAPEPVTAAAPKGDPAAASEPAEKSDYWSASKQNILDQEAAAAESASSQNAAHPASAASGGAPTPVPVGVINLATYHSPTVEEQIANWNAENKQIQQSNGAVEVGGIQLEETPPNPDGVPRYAPSKQDDFAAKLAAFAEEDSKLSENISSYQLDTQSELNEQSAQALGDAIQQIQAAAGQMALQQQMNAIQEEQSRAAAKAVQGTAPPARSDSASPAGSYTGGSFGSAGSYGSGGGYRSKQTSSWSGPDYSCTPYQCTCIRPDGCTTR